MITSIKSLLSVGRYSHFEGPVVLHQNQIIFGFNGTGKSTLSDVLYSICDQQHCDKLMKRKTLCSADGTTSEDMSICLGTSDSDLIFSNGQWSREENTYVFNDQYIDDYLFVGADYNIDGNPVVFGREGTRLSREKQQLQTEVESDIFHINEIISNNKAICEHLGIGKAKISAKTPSKRLQKIDQIKLFSESQREKVQADIDSKSAYDSRLQKLQQWITEAQKCLRLCDMNKVIEMQHFEKTLAEVPRVTNKEIADHVSLYMSHSDIAWLSKGIEYQSDDQYCPFCGQEIRSKSYTKLVSQIQRFIKSKQKLKADAITLKIKRIAPLFDNDLMASSFSVIKQILNENDELGLLHKSTIKILNQIQIPAEVNIKCYYSINDKIAAKFRNPYEAVSLNDDEKVVYKSILCIMRKLLKLVASLESEAAKIRAALENESEYEHTKALLEASFGANNDNFHDLLELSHRTLSSLSKIDDYQRKIDNLVENQRLEEINTILQDLNVNFTVQVLNGKYYVQIKGYVPEQYSKENKILCSEGERRILALAYFLQDLKGDNSPKTIVVDDPISSLDMNRKSVVAFKIVQLMSDGNNQVIVLSHDISFVEKLQSLINSSISDVDYLELRKSKEKPFAGLVLTDYLLDDAQVYERIIRNGEESNDHNAKILALMAIRPYVFIKTGLDLENPTYRDIEHRSTYFAHSIYAHSSRVSWKKRCYMPRSLRAYCRNASKATKFKIEEEKLVPDDFSFDGFNYDRVWKLYTSLSIENLFDLRLKAMVFRILLEASLFMIVSKKMFDPEHIGTEYTKAIKGTHNEQKTMSKKLDELYDFSKKYHHGADSGSTLGLSSLNPDEMIFFNAEITAIADWIQANPQKCNLNSKNYD